MSLRKYSTEWWDYFMDYEWERIKRNPIPD
jgi:hypothetical protein